MLSSNDYPEVYRKVHGQEPLHANTKLTDYPWAWAFGVDMIDIAPHAENDLVVKIPGEPYVECRACSYHLNRPFPVEKCPNCGWDGVHLFKYLRAAIVARKKRFKAVALERIKNLPFWRA